MIAVQKGLRYLLAITCLLLGVAAADAQDWSEEQMEVWKTVVSQWEASKAQDPTWPETYLHDAFLGWSDDNPMPRDKSSTERWYKYTSGNSKTLEQELNPVGIVVEGSVAVVHYYYSVSTENRKGERETNHGRYTDILIKEGEKWRFIAWRGGEDPRWKQ
jgi:ketosteroid isomerase-like protein